MIIRTHSLQNVENGFCIYVPSRVDEIYSYIPSELDTISRS